MAHQFTSYHDESTDFIPSQQQQEQHRLSSSEDFKASYDDLIDQYASPYARTSRHQTFSVQPPADGSRASHSLDQKPYDEAKGVDGQIPESPIQEYPPKLKKEKDVDTRGFWAKVLPDSLACRLYVLTVLIETTIDLAIEGDLLVRVNESDTANGTDSQKMPVYLSIFALAHVFQFVMAVDAVYARNTLQFMCLTVFNLLFLVYAIIQIGEIREILTSSTGTGIINEIPVQVLTTIIPCVISAAELAYIGLGWKIYHEFGWKVYKFLGADRRIKKMYAHYQIFECLVKFDVFFCVGWSVQFIWIVLQTHNWEYYLTIAALPLSVILLIEGHLAARHENKWMMATFMLGCVGALVYFVYKLVKVLMYRNTPEYSPIWESLTAFSMIAIVLLILTNIFTMMVWRNFGRGLKTTMSRGKTEGHKGSQSTYRGPMAMNPNRMSID